MISRHLTKFSGDELRHSYNKSAQQTEAGSAGKQCKLVCPADAGQRKAHCEQHEGEKLY